MNFQLANSDILVILSLELDGSTPDTNIKYDEVDPFLFKWAFVPQFLWAYPSHPSPIIPFPSFLKKKHVLTALSLQSLKNISTKIPPKKEAKNNRHIKDYASMACSNTLRKKIKLIKWQSKTSNRKCLRNGNVFVWMFLWVNDWCLDKWMYVSACVLICVKINCQINFIIKKLN